MWALVALAGAVGCRSLGKPPKATVGESRTLAEAYDSLDAPRAEVGLRNLSDNVLAWAARWTLIESAQERIDTSYFIVADDVFGLSFLGLLLDKARAGVQVRLLVDSRGSLAISSGARKDYLHALAATGNADVYVYNTLAAAALSSVLEGDLTQVLASTHNKLLIVDGERSVIGGRNIAGEYFTDLRDADVGWIDADVLVQGDRMAKLLTLVFEREVESIGRGGQVGPEDGGDVRARTDELLLHRAAMDAWVEGRVGGAAAWGELRDDEKVREDVRLQLLGAAVSSLPALPDADARARFEQRLPELLERAGHRSSVPAELTPEYAGEARVIHKFSAIHDEHNTVLQAIFDVAPSAQRVVRLETPYLLLHKQGLELLTRLRDLGVEVHVLTNSPMSSDSAATQAFFIEHWPELEARAPNLRVFAVKKAGRLMHAKRAVFDDDLVMVGTYNLDPLSRAVNSEIALVVKSPGYAAMVREEFDSLTTSNEVAEYLIERDHDGVALRWPEGHERAGRVKVKYGPDDHCPPETMARVRRLREALLFARPFTDVDGVYW